MKMDRKTKYNRSLIQIVRPVTLRGRAFFFSANTKPLLYSKKSGLPFLTDCFHSFIAFQSNAARKM